MLASVAQKEAHFPQSNQQYNQYVKDETIEVDVSTINNNYTNGLRDNESGDNSCDYTAWSKGNAELRNELTEVIPFKETAYTQ